MVLVETILSELSDCLFPQIFVIKLIIFVDFWRNQLSKTSKESTVWPRGICVAEWYIFWQDYELVLFFKTAPLFIVGRSVREGKVMNWLKLAKNWNYSTKIWKSDKIYLFLKSSSHFMLLCKKRLTASCLFKKWILIF